MAPAWCFSKFYHEFPKAFILSTMYWIHWNNSLFFFDWSFTRMSRFWDASISLILLLKTILYQHTCPGEKRSVLLVVLTMLFFSSIKEKFRTLMLSLMIMDLPVFLLYCTFKIIASTNHNFWQIIMKIF